MVTEFESLAPELLGPIDTRRLIPTAYPAVDLYANLAVDPSVWDALHQIESRTNPRLETDDAGLRAVPAGQASGGAGASFIMAPFANRRATRFSAGDFGIYYCAVQEETAIREVAYHRARFLRDSRQPPQTLAFRSIAATLRGSAFDVYHQPWPWLRSEDYRECQRFGAYVYGRAQIIRYESVRHRGNVAFAVLSPRALSESRHVAYLEMAWDGRAITHYSRVGGQIGTL